VTRDGPSAPLDPRTALRPATRVIAIAADGVEAHPTREELEHAEAYAASAAVPNLADAFVSTHIRRKSHSAAFPQGAGAGRRPRRRCVSRNPAKMHFLVTTAPPADLGCTRLRGALENLGLTLGRFSARPHGTRHRAGAASQVATGAT